MKTPKTTEYRFKVRSYELDSYGHVNNANYLNYLEGARWEYLKDIKFDYNEMILKGYCIYVARIEIDYKKSAFADDELVIFTTPLKKGAVSGKLEQIITRGGNENDIVAQAIVTWAFVDKHGKIQKIPDEFNVPGLEP
jgi:acyl-CoA thioester hydrolase